MRILKKISFLLLLITLVACGKTDKQGTETDVFKVGMEANYEPFNWTQSSAGEQTAPIEDGGYAGGYDVAIAQKIADKLHKKLVVVKLDWDGLIPALQSNKIDAIIAGMSPTDERRQEIDFTNSYYESEFVVVTRKDTPYAAAKTIRDFKHARVTAQLGTFHYDMIDQMTDAVKEEAMTDFAAMRVALESGKIDAYVSEKTVAVQAVAANDKLAMVTFDANGTFQVSADEVQTAIGVKKGSPLKAEIDAVLATVSKADREALMDAALRGPTQKKAQNFFEQMGTVFSENAPELFAGAGKTLYISLVGTIVGLLIGLLIGIVRTIPKPDNKLKRYLLKLVNWLLSIYIEIFRGTPMIVQAMVVFYGSALLFQVDMDKTLAALFIVSINTGAYMSEVVRGGVVSIDKGQFEAAQAIGMTHMQTMRAVILPQVLKNILPATGNEFVINIKDTSVLNVIGVTELYFVTKSIAATNYQFFQTFLVTCVFYFIMTFTVTRILRFIERKLSGKSSYTLASGQMQVAEIKE